MADRRTICFNKLDKYFRDMCAKDEITEEGLEVLLDSMELMTPDELESMCEDYCLIGVPNEDPF